MTSLECKMALLREHTAADKLSDAERARGLARLRAIGRPSTRRRLGVLALAGALALVVAAGTWMLRRDQRSREWHVVSGSDCVAMMRGEASVGPGCREEVVLVRRGVEATLASATQVSWSAESADEFHVILGRATFRVDHRRVAKTWRVRVSDGLIVDRGTRFAVEQGRHGGSLQVTEGAVDFVSLDGGSVRTVSAGESLIFGHPETVAPHVASPPSPASREEKAPVTKKDDAAAAAAKDDPRGRARQVLVLLQRLRSQGHFEEAMMLLDNASHDPVFAREQRERFSFEQGVLIEQVRGHDAACAHWRHHLTQYSLGSRAGEIRAALAACAGE